MVRVRLHVEARLQIRFQGVEQRACLGVERLGSIPQGPPEPSHDLVSHSLVIRMPAPERQQSLQLLACFLEELFKRTSALLGGTDAISLVERFECSS